MKVLVIGDPVMYKPAKSDAVLVSVMQREKIEYLSAKVVRVNAELQTVDLTVCVPNSQNERRESVSFDAVELPKRKVLPTPGQENVVPVKSKSRSKSVSTETNKTPRRNSRTKKTTEPTEETAS